MNDQDYEGNESACPFIYSDKIKDTYITYMLIAANVAVFIFDFLLKPRIDVKALFGLVPVFVKKGEWYRLVTSMFIHGGINHLVGNMLSLWGVGRMLEHRIGHLRMLLFYVVTGLIGSGFVYLFGNSFTITIGASGAVLGVMSVLMIEMKMSGNKVVYKRILLNLALVLYASLTVREISLFGHLGGIVGGLMIGFVRYLFQKKKVENPLE